MKISELFLQKRPVVSFEVFPPKPTSTFDSVFDCIKALQEYRPDFISVTYGAGGSTRGRTLDLAQMIKVNYDVEAVAHLTGVGLNGQQLDQMLDEIEMRGLENILALRGDKPQGDDSSESLRYYASDLVTGIAKRAGKFCVAVAAYPECHPESESMESDTQFLKAKLDAGADLMVTQIFFDNDIFYRFLDRIRSAGITKPVTAGIMPVFSAAQIARISSLCGASIPQPLSRLMARYSDDPQSMEQAGVDYAAEQISNLVSNNVDGIHLYTMNRPNLAKDILSSTGLRNL